MLTTLLKNFHHAKPAAQSSLNQEERPQSLQTAEISGPVWYKTQAVCVSAAVTICSALSRPAQWRPAAAVAWAGWWRQKRFHLFSLLLEQERRWWRSLIQWHTSPCSRCRCQNHCSRHLRGKQLSVMRSRSKLNIWLHATTLKQTLCQKSRFWQCKTIKVLWKLQWKQLRLH